MNITENFSLEEIEYSETGIRHGFSNKIPPDGYMIMETLFKFIMQPLRDYFGPIHITSGYRSDRINTLVGGSRHSQHVYNYVTGAACDFVSASNVSNIEIFNYIILKEMQYDQLILEYPSSRNGGWIHVSVAGEKRQTRSQVLVKDKGVPYMIINSNDNKYGVEINHD